MIPKIIHYCWLSGQEFPQDIQDNLDSWKAILPDYDFMFWDRKKSEVVDCIWIQQALEHKKYAFASDLIRLYAVHTYGGIYLDCDVEVIKKFDDLLDLPYFIGTEHTKEIEAAVFGSEKEAEWLSIIMEHYYNRTFVKSDGQLDMVVLPIIMKSRIQLIKKVSLMDDSQVKEATTLLKNESSFFLFSFDYFCTKNHETGIISKTKNTYTIHHYSSSWMPFSSKLRRNVMRTIGIHHTEKIISALKLRELRIYIKSLATRFK